MGVFLNSYRTNAIYATGGNSVVYQELFDGARSMGMFATHTFLSSGYFDVIYGTGTIHVMTVAGGGGGGMDMGGGGGAGGMQVLEYNMSPNSCFISVGGGGSGAPAAGTSGQPSSHQYTVSATNGSGTSIYLPNTTLVSGGGGYGGSSYFGYTPNNGYGNNAYGSGGGSSGYSDGNTGRGGSALSSPGLNGLGAGKAGGGSSGQYYSGGGGGAWTAGTGVGAAPHGGAGIQVPYLSPYYFSGGGGGSAYSLQTGGNGGIGGGGGGAIGSTSGGAGINNGSAGGGGAYQSWANTPGGNAGANTGGGGGGGSHYNANNKGGNGGSGIVIIRYPCYKPILTQNGIVLHYNTANTASYLGTGTTLTDLSPSALNATLTSTLSGTAIPTAIASNNPATTATTSILNTDTHTICFSIRIGAPSGTWDKIFEYAPAGTDRSPGVWRYPSERLIHWRYDPGNTGADLASFIGGNFPASVGIVQFVQDRWYYICVTKSGSTSMSYVNGVRVANETVAATKTAGTAAVKIFPGYTVSNSYMRHLHVYNRALSPEEIAANYSAIVDEMV